MASIKHNLFLINSFQKEREYKLIEDCASEIFDEFLKNKDYGEGIECFWFKIYVEHSVNYGRHSDWIYKGCAFLSLHIDELIFKNESDEGKIKLVLKASLILLKYLSERMVLPKGFNGNKLAEDFEMYLSVNKLLLSEANINKSILKYFDTTRFNFLITQAIEVNDSDIHYNLNDLQDFINNNLAGKTFGISIRGFAFGYEIFDFNGSFVNFLKKTENLKRYRIKNKNILIVKQFDYNEMKSIGANEQYGILKSKILEAINDIDKMPKKPKDFDKQNFYKEIDRILTLYELN